VWCDLRQQQHQTLLARACAAQVGGLAAVLSSTACGSSRSSRGCIGAAGGSSVWCHLRQQQQQQEHGR
jgi:hypothetical protein